MEIPKKERFSGCLIGQCLGDALGFPVEGAPASMCANYVAKICDDISALEQIGRGPYKFGQYTDDSQLAREFLESYAACKGFDPVDYSKRIAAIFAENRIVGRGMATEAAARRLARGTSWDRAGTPAPSAGNGSAMRAGPVGLVCCDDKRQLVQVAHDQGRITHQDRRCSAGAVAIAGAVSLVLYEESPKPRPFLTKLSEMTGEIDAEFASHLQALANWTSLSPDEAVKHIGKAGLASGYRDSWSHISPFVVGSVLWSLYSFLKTPDNYWQTICTAIAVGGDVDTTAAMAGAISGAHVGLLGLPGNLTAKLDDCGSWGFDDLVELAHRCHRIKFKGDEKYL